MGGGNSSSKKAAKAAQAAAAAAEAREAQLEQEEKEKNKSLMQRELQSFKRSRFSGGSLYDQITGNSKLG
ncbi:MAG: hypothetical protein ACTSR1_00285 [Candidatus Heimdallarchaeota archaeon]